MMRKLPSLAFALLVTIGACGRGANHNADSALNTDLSLAAQAKGYQPLDTMSAAERGAAAITVCSHLGDRGEAVIRGDLDHLAAGTFPALSVVLVQAVDEPAGDIGWSWGLTDGTVPHRARMFTYGEVGAGARRRCVGIGARRGTDVTSLDVEDHEAARAA